MNNIASERVRKRLTQYQLAEKLGVAERTIRNWERDENDVPSTKACEMAGLFGCSVDYLFGRCNERVKQSVVVADK